MRQLEWQRAVIKVGSSLIAPDGNRCSDRFVLPIAQFITESRKLGKEVILVSSGSVAAGRVCSTLDQPDTDASAPSCCERVGSV